MGKITALQVQKRNKERVNVFLDDDYAFSIALVEAAKLRKGQELTEKDIHSLKSEDDVNRAVDSAARFLANRPRSEVEIRRNLTKKSFDPEVVEAAVSRLSQMGYVDDTAFAQYWIENRDTFKPRGPMALRYELRQKGVADRVIDSVLETVDVFDAAMRAASGRANRFKGLDRRSFEQKVGSFLQRRGFTFETSRNVIEQLVMELTEADEQFFVDNESEA